MSFLFETGISLLPSPITEDKAVVYRPVDGVYDRSASRTNRKEAEAVVAFVVDHLKRLPLSNSDATWETIGVVTFNAQQQELIEDLLDLERQRSPELEPYFSKDVAEYVLIKNLENVQGDERDVMVFSTTFGPDSTGRLSLNFGPLNREGGERRLNVAITRARVSLHLLTSLRPEQIDLSRTRKRGVADLKHFVEYAQRGPRALQEEITYTTAEMESVFEEQVCAMLITKGSCLDGSFSGDVSRADDSSAGRGRSSSSGGRSTAKRWRMKSAHLC